MGQYSENPGFLGPSSLTISSFLALETTVCHIPFLFTLVFLITLAMCGSKLNSIREITENAKERENKGTSCKD